MTTYSNSTDNKFFRTVEVANSQSANTATVSITNSGTGAGTDSRIDLYVDTAGGNPHQRFGVTGGQVYSVGIDSSASGDPFNITTGNAITSGKAFTVDTNGQITKPLQTVFHAYLSATDSNVTGAAAVYSLGSGNVLTLSQQGSSITTGGVFTAPITGWYMLGCRISLGDISLMTSGSLLLNLNSGSNFFQIGTWNPTNYANASAQESIGGVIVRQFTVGDTVTVSLQISGGAGNTVDVLGSASGSTYYFGNLLC